MKNYTIYCTGEQTRKALELGAPIEAESLKDSSANWLGYIIKGNVCALPTTAEQMIGWLEEKEIFVDYTRLFGKYGYRLLELHEAGERNLHIQQQEFNTHKDAVLAAIDAALDYLIKAKKSNKDETIRKN